MAVGRQLTQFFLDQAFQEVQDRPRNLDGSELVDGGNFAWFLVQNDQSRPVEKVRDLPCVHDVRHNLLESRDGIWVIVVLENLVWDTVPGNCLIVPAGFHGAGDQFCADRKIAGLKFGGGKGA